MKSEGTAKQVNKSIFWDAKEILFIEYLEKSHEIFSVLEKCDSIKLKYLKNLQGINERGDYL